MTDPADLTRASAAMDADWQLRAFVSWVNASANYSLSVTLFVGGAVVTGQLIGGREYFRLFGEWFAEAIPESEEVRQRLRATYTELGEDLYALDDDDADQEGEAVAGDYDEEDDDHDDRPSPSYIHLKDAHIALPGAAPIPQNRGLLWRGRLSAVDGWSLGVLGPGPSE